jgi:hypothetical protein
MKALVVALAVLLTMSPAYAKHHHEQVQGDVIPDTNGLPYPITDHACDKAMDNSEFDTAIALCEQSAADYGRLADKTKMPSVFDRLVYNQAYTLYEIAFAYNQTGDNKKGKSMASMSYDLFRMITDPYFKKLEPIMGWKSGEREYVHFDDLPATKQKQIHATLTEDQLHIGGGFLHLMQQVHALYPEICTEIDSLTGNAHT